MNLSLIFQFFNNKIIKFYERHETFARFLKIFCSFNNIKFSSDGENQQSAKRIRYLIFTTSVVLNFVFSKK